MASIFTRIINGEIPSYKIAEDENYYAFLDINPVAKAHTLVVPKQETDYIFDIDNDTLGGLVIFAKRVAKAIEKSVECKRIGVAVLGLEVPHAHIHLIPLNSESDVDFKKAKLQLSTEEFKQIAEKIRENFV
ncbi:MAG: HIT family protein [Prevotellaceae bacterium]|jgi:histidine triad (HIT) family protein|nr:HIT family protein [Prevotellaceae bacterium]